jgi:hypothetical protein
MDRLKMRFRETVKERGLGFKPKTINDPQLKQ